MAKPRAIQWLESETGQEIEYTPEEQTRDRHLSVRVTGELLVGLEALASERNQTVSQLVRDLVVDAVERRSSVADLEARALVDRLAADVEEVRRRLAG